MKWSCTLIGWFCLALVALLLPTTQAVFLETSTSEHGIHNLQATDPKSWTEHNRMERDLSILPVNDDTMTSFLQNDNAAQAAVELLTQQSHLTERLTELFTHATSPGCRALVLQHLGYFVKALGREEPPPFAQLRLNNTCPEPAYDDWANLPQGVHVGQLQNRSYQPPRSEAAYVDDPTELKLLYLILAHDHPQAIVRLIRALDDNDNNNNDNNNTKRTTLFVIHIDAKESSDETRRVVNHFAAQHPYVHVLPRAASVRINWGGFSMVQATLQMLRYATGHLESNSALEFDKAIHLSHTTYPLASNREIREELAKYPLDANLFQVIMKPHRPPSWNYFVECDDQLHRIFHLPVPNNASNGFELFQSSQWFVMSREFAEYLAANQPGTFVHGFLPYAEHMVVADETFFGTVLRNTPFCLKHVNRNYLYLEFDRWESDIPAQERDARKCMMKDKNHCGRSPTTLTAHDAPMLELSGDLFARKFTDDSAKDLIDHWRLERELQPRGDLEFEGHGVLIVARETVKDSTPLCMGLGDVGNQAKLVPCFHEWVPPNLLDGWETGAVIAQETLANNRWEFAPCTKSSGRLRRDPLTGSHTVVLPENNTWSVIGPRCMLKQKDGVRTGRCWDGVTAGEGGPNATHVYPCLTKYWGQLVSLGDGRITPPGSLFTALSQRHLQRLEKKGTPLYPYTCLAAVLANNTGAPSTPNTTSFSGDLRTVPCNVDPDKNENLRIVEWVIVPFILEEDHTDADDANENDNDETHVGNFEVEQSLSIASARSCPEQSSSLVSADACNVIS